MEFKSNARWNEPKENGTIFDLKNNGLRISIHRVIHIEDTWFLSCYALGISRMDLHEPDFAEAVEKAKIVINHKIGELIQEYDKIVADDEIKFV